mgnify:CR=1 FL=1
MFLGVLAASIALGFWLGAVTAPVGDRSVASPTSRTKPGSKAEVRRAYAPPLFFAAPMAAGGDRATVLQEIQWAARSEVHGHMVSVPLPWPHHGIDVAPALQTLSDVLHADPAGYVLLHLRLDPPDSWLAANPEAGAVIPGQSHGTVSLASSEWRAAVRHGLELLLAAINQSDHRDHVLGFVLSCLPEGRWSRPNGFDASPANVKAFQEWLRHRYGSDEALQAAWGDAQVTMAAATVAERPITDDPRNVFVSLPAQRRWSDYWRFASDNTAEAIEEFTECIQTHGPDSIQVFAFYGASFEALNNDSGQLALERLLMSKLNGFVTPVSYVDRGLGGAGGFMGPVDSARAHGKWWHLLDDTRTGLARDAGTGAISRMAGVRPEDVYNVQARNFAAALTHQLGLMWMDAAGDGQLLEPEMWKRFQAMTQAYAAAYGDNGYARANAPTTAYDVRPDMRPVLMTVVDENSRFYQLCDAPLNEFLLIQARDAALRSGAPVQFRLFHDVLEGNAPPASVYLFLNLFQVNEEQRSRLHARLQQQQATAIWLYAPGYFAGDSAAPENIAALTQLPVKAFEGPAKSGSVFQLDGRWIATGTDFGPTREWNPLFYIEGENLNAVATYRDSGKVSVAIVALESGWESIFVAEPCLTPGLLRELLQIVEQRVFYRRNSLKCDVTHIGPNLFALHASERGERVIDFGWPFAVQDVLLPERGWPERQFLNVLLNTGETRIFKLTPVMPEDQP